MPEVNPAHFQELENCLRLSGIECKEAPVAGSRDPLLILIDSYSTKICQQINNLQKQDEFRTVVIVWERRNINNIDMWELLKAAAVDILAWDQLPQPAAHLKALLERWQEIDVLMNSPLVRQNIIGKSPAWLHMLEYIVEMARYTHESFLLSGESGTGKELIARLIHTLDPSPENGKLIVLDCTTIQPELSGSELFGHERGAFTGAYYQRDGVFAQADNGTLFLDEISELPLNQQGQLLRAIQEHSYKRVGSNVWHDSEFRLICATNRNLTELAEQGRFRFDLLFRISSCLCHLPSLRERLDDILVLADHFVKKNCAELPQPYWDNSMKEYLLTRPYPGNVRELKQLVEKICHRHLGLSPISIGELPEVDRHRAAGPYVRWTDDNLRPIIKGALELGFSMKEIGHLAEEVAIKLVLEDEGGNLQRAALKLGVTDRALQIRRATQRQRNIDVGTLLRVN